MEQRSNLPELLEYIHPSDLNYQEWLNVGMALKEEGYSAADWEAWSSRDVSRYHRGECTKKWNTFHGTGIPVTGGTIVQMAKEHGWAPPAGHELDWNDTIEKDDFVILDKNWVEGKEIRKPGENWNPVSELIRYLDTLFEAAENVGYVTEAYRKQDEKDTRFLPSKGNWDRTAGQLIEALNKCGGDICSVIGDYREEAGAWIRFNPLDGKGCKNENVTEYRYALVESDDMDLDRQNALIRELELPVACLVHSGKKSIHAIVRIEAGDYQEYRKRVDYLYKICQKNGLNIDTQNRNPSRLSRMPGVTRNGNKQYLIDTNIGKKSWDEWYEWIESVNDDLPEPEGLNTVWDNLPELAPALIDGVLRQGHKMLIAGPSKAGKSFALIELCCAIAEGRRWLEWQCAKGRVMYVNLELDRASCLHRFKDVYTTLGWKPDNLQNIDIWNLRGKSVPMDKLAPKLIRRAAKKDYIAIIIDPIYKVITGDENSADQMAAFCNQFDKICTELGTAVIYCHHHSKGLQGGKRSMDRASGSGVFARDPDALLDLIELDLTDACLTQQENKAVCDVCFQYLNRHFEDWEDEISQDDMCSSTMMVSFCKKKLSAAGYADLNMMISEAVKRVHSLTAWRIEGTLREFSKFTPVNLWFDYPVHNVDKVGTLNDIQVESEKPAWKRAMDKRKPKEQKLKERKEALETAFDGCSINGQVTVSDLEEYMALTKNSVKNRIKEHGGFKLEDGIVSRI